MSTEIAIVNGDPKACLMYSREISKLGYREPTVFCDGASFVRDLFQRRPNVDWVVIDHEMPATNAKEVVWFIFRNRPRAKVIVLADLDPVKEKGLLAGTVLLVGKRASEEAIADAVRHSLTQ